jgi:enamine deaminase RidA (YjgF/YER057c/UK114 family)
MSILDKLNELNIEIPEPAKPVANYLPAKVFGDQVYISGQLPLQEGKLISVGKLGDEVSVEEALFAAKLCFLNALAAAKTVVNLSQLDSVIKITGFVNSVSDFYQQPQVINGASDIAVKIFGEQGRHAREAVGVNVLPLNASVEVSVIFGLKHQ